MDQFDQFSLHITDIIFNDPGILIGKGETELIPIEGLSKEPDLIVDGEVGVPGNFEINIHNQEIVLIFFVFGLPGKFE